uniref:Uncharacterized protein n=1 Tax=Romanomermis culicivorax TaxID=13658 RepID=A0A915KYU1_ROMCU
MQPKPEATKDSEDAEKLTKVIVEETPPPLIAASVPHSTTRIEESKGSDYVVEVEDKISAISDEEATEQRPARMNHPQIQANVAKGSLMEIERNMIIATSFGTVRPTAAPQSSPSASICSTATQPFQLSQAPPTSTGVWMPIRCTLPAP